jgi:predicted PurR-regulated permease PerM
MVGEQETAGSGGRGGGEAEEAPPARVVIDVAPAALAKVGVAFFAGWLIARVWPVIVLVLVSLMFVATFYPWVRRLQARAGRGGAITAVMMGTALAVAALFALMIPPLARQASGLIEQLPTQARAMESAARQAGVPLKLSATTERWMARVSSMGPELMDVLATVLSGITGVLTVAVLTVYLLIDGPRVGTAAVRLLPRRARLPARRMSQEIADQVGTYIRGQLLTSAIAGLFAYVLLLALGVPEPLALAFLMAITDVIPLVGPLIGTVPAVLLALTRGWPTAAIVLVGYVIYHQVESHVIVPRIYCGTMKLAPSIIVIAILVGATLMGVIGALIALPVAAAVPVVLRTIGEWRDREAESEAELPG